jgi:hypothetical protein
MAGLNTGTPIVQVFHEKSRILPDVARVLACLYEKDINFKRHKLLQEPSQTAGAWCFSLLRFFCHQVTV